MNLVLANLFAALSTTLPAVMEHHRPHLAGLSAATDAFMCASAAASILAQLLVGADQFLAVTDPLTYEDRVSEGRCVLACAAVWACSICAGVVAGVDGAGGLISHNDAPGFCVATAASLFVIVFGLPSALLTYIYTRVFLAARSNCVRTRRNSAGSATLDSYNNPPVSSCENSEGQSFLHHSYYQTQQSFNSNHSYRSSGHGAAMSYHQHHHHSHNHHHHHHHNNHNQNESLAEKRKTLQRQPTRLSVMTNASVASLAKLGETAAATLRRHHEETHAAKVTLVLIVNLLGCWTPYFVSVLLNVVSPRPALAHDFRLASLSLAALSPVLTPLLYAYRSPRVRREVRRSFGLISPAEQRRAQRHRRRHHYPKKLTLPSLSAMRSPTIEEEGKKQAGEPVHFQLGGTVAAIACLPVKTTRPQVISSSQMLEPKLTSLSRKPMSTSTKAATSAKVDQDIIHDHEQSSMLLLPSQPHTAAISSASRPSRHSNSGRSSFSSGSNASTTCTATSSGVTSSFLTAGEEEEEEEDED